MFDDRHFGYFSVFYVGNTKACIIAEKARAREEEVRRRRFYEIQRRQVYNESNVSRGKKIRKAKKKQNLGGSGG